MATSQRIARIVIESSLPQLGGEFDYIVPEYLDHQVEIGCRVAVPIGKSKKLSTGFVTEVLSNSEFAKREISQVLGPAMLTSDVLDCCRVAARRQVVTLGELLKAAAPAYMPTQSIPAGYAPISAPPVFRWADWRPPIDYLEGNGIFFSSPTPKTVDGQLIFDWATLLLAAAFAHFERGESSILVVPEMNDFLPVIEAARAHGVAELLVALDDKRVSSRYQRFWEARNGSARIYVGTRSAILHPAKNLGFIAVFDDLDESLRSKSSPYLHAREFALIRAQASGARVIIASHYRSLEAQRLVEIGYAKELTNPFRPPRLAHYETSQQLPGEFFGLLRSGLEQGSVLVLVPNRSWSVLARCSACAKSLVCQSCGAPGYMPNSQTVECRLCSAVILACSECGSREFNQGRAGAARIAAELGKAFPGTVVRDFSGQANKTRVGSRDIVVATPSAAPRLASGYAALAVIDCGAWLNRSTLRSEQFAARDWQEAIALLSPSGRAALFGVPNVFGRVFALQDFVNLAAHQLAEMQALRFPPAWRVCRITAETSLLLEAADVVESAGAEVLNRPNLSAARQTSDLLLRFRYQDGMRVASALAELAISSSLRGSTAGKRRLKIAMDDLGEL